ncbi:hypothetical protein [Deinococcus hopiensis]|uniref:Uncharacterized protein n=1 Tax=Deinococcus hopiensis KR-140 TaxID=695939 RepID=A0A1W1UKG9_9DEIO|nr:hypothetical protein [Deinococcus hopiensis]SMB81625.1 hypothetical protein SAMN00790413_04650 [Deinococcus hopiensis KR-140]
MTDVYSLPRGITGFAPKGERHPWVESADFHRLCNEAARYVRARLVRVATAEGQVDRNFHVAEVQIGSERTSILCNAHYPWLALVEPTHAVDFASLAFNMKWKEVPGLAQALKGFSDFRVLDIAYLEAFPKSQVLQDLWACEVKQVQSWKPQRIGEIIFNAWD